MLERLVELTTILHAPKSASLPTEKSVWVQRSVLSPHKSMHQRLLVELADLQCCLRDAQLTRLQEIVVDMIVRPRARFCYRCNRRVPQASEATPRCPYCSATRSEGWTYEPFPTPTVLAQELTRRTKTPWTARRARKLRNTAYAAITHAAVLRGLLHGETET